MELFKNNNWIIDIWGKLKGISRPIYYNGFDGNTETTEHGKFNKNLSRFS